MGATVAVMGTSSVAAPIVVVVVEAKTHRVVRLCHESRPLVSYSKQGGAPPQPSRRAARNRQNKLSKSRVPKRLRPQRPVARRWTLAMIRSAPIDSPWVRLMYRCYPIWKRNFKKKKKGEKFSKKKKKKKKKKKYSA